MNGIYRKPTANTWWWVIEPSSLRRQVGPHFFPTLPWGRSLHSIARKTEAVRVGNSSQSGPLQSHPLGVGRAWDLPLASRCSRSEGYHHPLTGLRHRTEAMGPVTPVVTLSVSLPVHQQGDGEPSPGFEEVTGHTARGTRGPQGREQPSADDRQPDGDLSSAATDRVSPKGLQGSEKECGQASTPTAAAGGPSGAETQAGGECGFKPPSRGGLLNTNGHK